MITNKDFWKEPSHSDKNFIITSAGGYNKCVHGNGQTKSALPNCVGYAWGVWYSLMGKAPKLSRGNAENWWRHNDGYKRSQTPEVGAVMVWAKGSQYDSRDGCGHIAIVKDVFTNGDVNAVMSEYNSKVRWTQKKLKKSSNYYIYSKAYKFLGFILFPEEEEIIMTREQVQTIIKEELDKRDKEEKANRESIAKFLDANFTPVCVKEGITDGTRSSDYSTRAEVWTMIHNSRK